MTQIPPYSLWIGSTGDLQDLRHLYDAGISAIVQVAYEEPLFSPVLLHEKSAATGIPRDFILCRFPLVDGGDNAPELVRLAISTLTRLLEHKFATLVCCQAGLSRSPAIAAAALSRIAGQPFADSLAHLSTHQAWSIHPALLTQVQTLSTERW